MKKETIDSTLTLLGEMEKTKNAANELKKLANKCQQIQESTAQPFLKRMELCKALSNIDDVYTIDDEVKGAFGELYQRILGALAKHAKAEAEKLDFYMRMLNNKFNEL